MYVCLKACKVGFLAGCRPLIGVDGCHLKGPYPGMSLVAVSMDGNKNIYPVAWAVVEVENTQTWTWFLSLLMEDIEKVDGEGLTIMSDRQKGLLEAFNTVTPKAEIRFCARHIWANFKLQWSGTLMKESFWAAARACPRALKEARDKPIISLMEWIRRYIMKRHYDKRTGAAGFEDRVMPFVTKYLKWVDNETRFCTLIPTFGEEFEVVHRGKQKAVNLTNRTCTCKTWELTGIPCPHAMMCITDQRHEVLDYVDEAYTKATYLRAFQHPIAAMPGYEDWEKVGVTSPTPPPFKKLPGRPKLKKWRREVGEGTSGQPKKIRQIKTCGKCGLNGHNMKTCKNPSMSQEKEKVTETRGMSKSAWSAKVRDDVARRKAKKLQDAAMVAALSGPSFSQQPSVQESQASVNHGAPTTNSKRKLAFED
ncbi:uncharacterized protein LOC141638481 [Silene latifolia]|uniref:uncharacterized protein LOC141638481 n=1 Tax=Silene latifolia TaxID=37657 RepID=UPI003D780AAB